MGRPGGRRRAHAMNVLPLYAQLINLFAAILLLLSFAMLAQRRVLSLIDLFAAQGLTTVGVERLPTHGGSLRIFAERTEDQPVVGPSVDLLLREEAAWGIGQPERYDTFGADAARIRRDLVAFVAESRAAGRRIAAAWVRKATVARAGSHENNAAARPSGTR